MTKFAVKQEAHWIAAAELMARAKKIKWDRKQPDAWQLRLALESLAAFHLRMSGQSLVR